MEKISKGLSFKGLISTIGLVLFIIGLAITIPEIISNRSFIVCAFGIMVTIIGFLLFISIRGVLIDHDKQRIKPYIDLILFKIGTWEPLAHYEKIILKYLSESQTMNSRGNSTNFAIQSFDIILTSNNKKEIIIKEFLNYEDAKSFLIEYSQRLDKEYLDMYERMKERIQERKQYGRQ